ncbi:invasion-associated locus B family protein [Sulfitobacter sp. SK012]|uniref:invasion associated locus B family protein n=1 Tax=Sulfitobacter sp. SK012 TaxID=1389005 RepID=UPI000E0B00BE|nr:invasion associated locus B family protein [Sulfitobacter sp. SK012]AXI48870.1 invasion-associated locus B family protein [Sulfitobacter sp. SK012]
MFKLMSALPLCAALALAAPVAFAQETTTAETDAPAEPTVDDLLSIADDTESEVGKPYTKEVIGGWEMRCIKNPDAEDPCQMYQLLSDDEGVPVAEISIFRLPEGSRAIAGATVIVPLETALAKQLTIIIDGAKARRYPFAFCNPVGCYVRMGLTAEDVAAFKRGNGAIMSIVPALAPDQTVELKLSLDGFTAGYDKVSTIVQ